MSMENVYVYERIFFEITLNNRCKLYSTIDTTPCHVHSLITWNMQTTALPAF